MRPGLARSGLDAFINQRRENDDLQGITATKAIEDAPTVQLRHHQIEDDEVWMELPEHLERLEAILRGGHIIAFAPENHFKKIPDRFVVIDD
jgi:hypothetical protein